MELRQQQKKFILHDDLRKVMIKLSVPAIIAMVLYGLNAFMDTVYIGQLLSEDALSGVALAFPLTNLMLGIGSWIGMGAGNKISILLGEDDMNIVKKVMPNANLITILASLLFALPTYFFAEYLIKMMGGTGDVLIYGVRYFKITLIASPLWIYGLQLNFIVRAEGKMKTAAIMMTYGLIVNLILTPLFIIQFNMDVDGAAWATNIGMLIYCIVGYIYFKNGRASFPTKIWTLEFDKTTFNDILKLGFPGLIMSIMSLIQAIVVFNAITKIGDTADLALFAAVVRIQMFIMTPLFGLMRALQPVVGVNYGAGQYDRVKQSFILFCKTGFWIVFPFTILLILFPQQSVHLVLPDIVLSEEAILNFRIFMAIIPALPFVFMALTFMPAINRPKPASMIGLARQLVFYIPVMLFLPKWTGISGIYWGSTVIDVIITVWVLTVIYQSFKKLDQKHETY